MYYCEEDIENMVPSYFTYAFRRALTDPNVEELINEQVNKTSVYAYNISHLFDASISLFLWPVISCILMLIEW